MTPLPPRQQKLADYWDLLVSHGVSNDDADAHVQRLADQLDEQGEPKQEKPEISALASAGLGAAQGATFGLGDEIAAGLEAAVPKEGTTFGERYTSAKDAEALTRRANPKSALGADLLTSLLLPGAGGLKVVRGMKGTRLVRALKSAAALGGAGAVEGAARGDNAAERVAGAVVGGGLGAAAGASPVAMEFAKEYAKVPLRPAMRAMKNLSKGESAAADVGEAAARKARLEALQEELLGEQVKTARAKNMPKKAPSKEAQVAKALGIPEEQVAGKIGPRPEPVSEARDIVNPKTGKPVTEEEVQAVIDKETRMNKVIKERKQRGATTRQLAHRAEEHGDAIAKRAEAATVPKWYDRLSDDELRERIALDNGPTEQLKAALAQRAKR